MKVDERLVSALLRLRDPSLAAFVEHLEGMRKAELENMLKLSEPVAVYRQQGRVQAISEIVSLISDAERLRDKLGRMA